MSINETIRLKERLIEYFRLSPQFTDKDKEIIDFLCFATNTLPVVEYAFEKAKALCLPMNGFYEIIVSEFIKRDMFPICVDKIVTARPELLSYALSEVLSKKHTSLSIANNRRTPYLDADVIRVPFECEWGDYINVGYFDRSEHTYVLEQLVSKLNVVQYEFKGEVKLVTGYQIRTLSAGTRKFYYGSDWLIVEFEQSALGTEEQ